MNEPKTAAERRQFAAREIRDFARGRDPEMQRFLYHVALGLALDPDPNVPPTYAERASEDS